MAVKIAMDIKPFYNRTGILAEFCYGNAKKGGVFFSFFLSLTNNKLVCRLYVTKKEKGKKAYFKHHKAEREKEHSFKKVTGKKNGTPNPEDSMNSVNLESQ